MHRPILCLYDLIGLARMKEKEIKKCCQLGAKKMEREGIGTERKCDGLGRKRVKHYHTMHSLHKSFELLKVVSLHENRAKPEIGKNR